MSNIRRTRHLWLARIVTAGLLALAALAPGCSEGLAPSPQRPSPPSPPPPPSPPLVLAPPVIGTLSERVGSTAGGEVVKIEGTGFLEGEGGAVVIFGGVRSPKVSHVGTTIIMATVPAHAAGLVDLVVTNPDGQAARLADAYTFVSPGSFDSKQP